MPNRRQFLYLSSAFTFSNLLFGCQNSSTQALQINTLKGSISPQLLALFRSGREVAFPLKFKPTEQLAELFDYLKTVQTQAATKSGNILRRSEPVYDLVTLGHGWYREAIAANLIQPLALQELPAWQKLRDPWQTFLKRDKNGVPNSAGKIWGQPYRWGTTMLVYRKDKLKQFGWTPTDWADLWREELVGKISLLNHSREVLGLVLKAQGKSYNETDSQAIADLETDLNLLHQSVKFYSSTDYLQPLTMGDTWVAQGWSQDILPMLKRYPNLGAVVPQSGTALWCDLWVQPTKSEKSFANLKPWLEFCWQPAAIAQFARSGNSASPLIYETPNLEAKITENPLIYVNPEIFQKSELIETLPSVAIAQYQDLWQGVRTRN